MISGCSPVAVAALSSEHPTEEEVRDEHDMDDCMDTNSDNDNDDAPEQPRRQPLPYLILKAAGLFPRRLPTFLQQPSSNTTNSRGKQSVSFQEMQKQQQQLQQLDKQQKECELQQEEFMEAMVAEARMYLQLDANVRKALGSPIDVIGKSKYPFAEALSSGNSNTTASNNSVSNTTASTRRRAIRVQGIEMVPVELGFQVRGPYGSGLAICMATREQGIVRLTLQAHSSMNMRVINVSLSPTRKKKHIQQ